MILEAIKICNWRAFYGENNIIFSKDPKKNITLIHAENGIGKTTILNCILWCFYGEFTKNLEKPKDILNNDAKKSGIGTASVEVTFEHENVEYIAKRFWSLKSFAQGDFVIAKMDTGSQEILKQPETFINTVLPKEMAGHFLYDGESAIKFIAEEDNLQGAIRDILGCALIETAIDDLKRAADNFRRQIPAAAGSSEAVALNGEIEGLIKQINQANKARDKLQNHSDAIEAQVKDIEAKLRQSAGAKELQEQRDILNTELLKAKKQKEKYDQAHLEFLGKNGQYIVSKPITEETWSFLDAKEHKGQIPSPYNEEFVKDLLSQAECICGAKLKAGSPEAKKVAKLLEHAADKVMRDRITKVKAHLAVFKNEKNKVPAAYYNTQKNVADTDNQIRELENKLGEISLKLKGSDLDDIGAREQRHDELREEMRKIDQQIGSLNNNIKDSEDRKKQLEIEIGQFASKNRTAAIFEKRRNLAETVKEKLEISLEKDEKEARGILRATINKLLKTTTTKALKVYLGDDYKIGLSDQEGNLIAKSSGENQLLGISFTAALIQYARVRENAEAKSHLPGTIAPLILDAPFSSLDPGYQKAVAENIPKLAGQVVLLLYDSKEHAEIIERTRDRIGAEYLLVRHNKGKKKHETNNYQEFDGESIQRVFWEAPFDGTEVKEIKGAL